MFLLIIYAGWFNSNLYLIWVHIHTGITNILNYVIFVENTVFIKLSPHNSDVRMFCFFFHITLRGWLLKHNFKVT